MENKLEYILTLIHMDTKDVLKNPNLQRVVVNSKNSLITIFLETSNMFTLKTYLEFTKKMNSYFNTSIILKVKNLGDKSLYLDDYFKYFLPKYITYFKERLKINGENNNYVVVYNQGEFREINNYLEDINKELVNLGYNEITVYLDETERSNVQKLIHDNLDNLSV